MPSEGELRRGWSEWTFLCSHVLVNERVSCNPAEVRVVAWTAKSRNGRKSNESFFDALFF